MITVSLAAACAPSTVPTSELARYPRRMNPEDASARTIYLAADGTCYVELPFQEPPSSGGQPQPQEAIVCPEAMRDPVWQACVGDEIRSTENGDDCVCDRSGNPPPPSVPRVKCPAR